MEQTKRDPNKNIEKLFGPTRRVGMITVIEATEKRRGGYTVWRCRCDCGNELEIDTQHLRQRAVLNCGCDPSPKGRPKDLTGQRFGKLVALEITEKRQWTSPVWRCRCDCGEEVEVPSKQLLAGYVKSCGCLSHPPLKDFVGVRFGRLIVEGHAGKLNGQHLWRCRCDCGNITEVRQTYLQSGKTQSCGCLNVDCLIQARGLVDGTSIATLEYFRENLSASNKSGYNGVYQNKKTGKWVAQITFKGKTKYLGTFAEKKDAIRARRRAEEEVDDFLENYYDRHPERMRPCSAQNETSA